MHGGKYTSESRVSSNNEGVFLPPDTWREWTLGKTPVWVGILSILLGMFCRSKVPPDLQWALPSRDRRFDGTGVANHR